MLTVVLYDLLVRNLRYVLMALWLEQTTQKSKQNKDGPDEAHAQQLARNELAKADGIRRKYESYRQREAEYRKQAKL